MGIVAGSTPRARFCSRDSHARHITVDAPVDDDEAGGAVSGGGGGGRGRQSSSKKKKGSAEEKVRLRDDPEARAEMTEMFGQGI